jgi:shikimate kinase
MDETNQDSLALYLQMNHQQLCSLLLATGLARLHERLQKIQTLRNHSGWDTFCVKQSLEGYYFDAMVVNNNRH